MVALKKKGDLRRGADSFEVCTACHLHQAEGTADGTYPRLAGQHAAFLMKQLADIRVGLRDNPFMFRFAATLTDPQELADVSAYVASLPVPRENGRGPGTNLTRGKALYEKDCGVCHGAAGQGDSAKFFPQVAGQHYKYMLRQVVDTSNGRRRNANPEIVRSLAAYGPEELIAVCDYASRLPVGP